MKLFSGIVFFFLLAITFQSCVKCREKDGYEGIVLQSYDSAGCIINDQFPVINSQLQLDSATGWYRNNYNLQRCDTQQFDFNQYTILCYGFDGSCHSSCVTDVEVDAADSAYVFTLKTWDCLCWSKVAEIHRSIVVVPKLPPGYTVKFVQKSMYSVGD